jgi:hypothetical protein
LTYSLCFGVEITSGNLSSRPHLCLQYQIDAPKPLLPLVWPVFDDFLIQFDTGNNILNRWIVFPKALVLEFDKLIDGSPSALRLEIH